ncbi:adenosylhomocysteinase [Niallia sp. Krafla_26]|uniref:adenosylhomocysteinase n=1 Tax=Niallia sp. Krafla_26 TaxID=3064703 RepID=UPI003D16C370
MENKSIVKDLSLAPGGHLKIDWVKSHMPVLNSVENTFKEKQPFKGLNVTICLHLEAKTAYLAKVVQSGGANVTICGSNPLSTQDDVAAALVEDGLTVYAKHNPSKEEYQDFLIKSVESKPDLIIDDGGELVTLLHSERPDLRVNVRGGCEETTTGVIRDRALENTGNLAFSMVAVNDAQCKYLFDNRYGTGQSVFDGIMRTTNLIIAGKTVVVVGYGWCGKGVAMRAKGLGAKVVVTEVDSIKAIEAHMDGFTVLPMMEAAKFGDFFITVTSNYEVIRKEHMEVMKDGAILSNAGHFDVEVSKPGLDAISTSKRTVRANIEEYTTTDGRKLYLLAEGRLVNLGAADGHPAEIMDMTFALQALSLEYINDHYQELKPQILNVPRSVDEKVAQIKLQSEEIVIDTLTEEQTKYLSSWEV